MRRLARDIEKFDQLDAVLYPILVDDEKNAKTMDEKYAQGKYAIYYDESNEIPKRLHQENKILKLGRMPGLLVVDKKGIVRYAYYGESMSDIPKNEEILKVLESF